MIPDYVIANDGLDALLVENAEMDPGDDEASNECVRDLVFGCWLTVAINAMVGGDS